MYLETVFSFYVLLYHFVGHSFFGLIFFGSFSDIIKRNFSLTLAKLNFYVDMSVWLFVGKQYYRLAMMAPVSRIMVRQPNNKGNAGSATNGMPPTSSMGCGTWGGNIVSENIALKHYMNTTWVARPIPEDMPSLQELFGDFYKDGMDVE